MSPEIPEQSRGKSLMGPTNSVSEVFVLFCFFLVRSSSKQGLAVINILVFWKLQMFLVVLFWVCSVLFFFLNLLNMYLCSVLFCLLINEVILCKPEKKVEF